MPDEEMVWRALPSRSGRAYHKDENCPRLHVNRVKNHKGPGAHRKRCVTLVCAELAGLHPCAYCILETHATHPKEKRRRYGA